MLPNLISLGPVNVSSFGAFLVIALVAGVFVLWRLARSYELNEEKILDLVLLTFFGGLLGSRIYFALFNFDYLDSPLKFFLITQYPGLSFWGALIGGGASLWFFANRLKVNFWQVVDYFAVAVLLVMIIGDIGCFLGGCQLGVNSNLIIATPVVGQLGKRFPVSLIEGILLLWLYLKLYSRSIKFHFAGQIVASFLIWVGLIKFFLDFFRADSYLYLWLVSWNQVLSILAIYLGIKIYYLQSKRSLKADLRHWKQLLITPKGRAQLLLISKKSWYNQRVNFKVKMGALLGSISKSPRKLRRKFNVKSTPTQLK